MISCPECEGIKLTVDFETNNKYCEDCACLIAGTQSFTEQNFQTYEQKLLSSLYSSQNYKRYSNRQSYNQSNSGIDKFKLQSVRKKTKIMACELSLKNCFTEQVLSLYRSYKEHKIKQIPNIRINQTNFIQAAFALITKNNSDDNSINSFINTCKGLGVDCKTTRKYYFELENFIVKKSRLKFADFGSSLEIFVNQSACLFGIVNERDRNELINKCHIIHNILTIDLNTEIQFLCVYVMGLVWIIYKRENMNYNFVLKEREIEMMVKLAESFNVEQEYLKNSLVYLKKSIRDELQEKFPYMYFVTNRTLYMELECLFENGKIVSNKEKLEVPKCGILFTANNKEIEDEAVKYLID